MSQSSPRIPKRILDKDLDKFANVEEAAGFLARSLVAPGLALLFLAFAAIFASLYVFGEPRAAIVIAAVAIAGYMALNIGANDVANNVGPAVGARAITMGGALVMAAIAETAGALIAGGRVVETIANGIMHPDAVTDPGVFIRLMVAALIASALWIHLSTWLRAPVSTTHAIVGSVFGAGAAAAGFSAVNWLSMGAITASWVFSPLAGGAFAAAMLAFIEATIIYQDNKIAAARRWVPLLIAAMAGAFAAYLMTIGVGKMLVLETATVVAIGVGSFLAGWIMFHGIVRRQSQGLENRNQSLRRLFVIPLVISAALLSFAHGANDVANAVGPLAAIIYAADTGEVAAKAAVPFWVMLIGALGISVGLLLFGPRLIRIVGAEITKLNPVRAYCIALSTAFTVIVASWLGLPVSTTHTAVGSVFGVGFYREWSAIRSIRRRTYLLRKSENLRPETVTADSAIPAPLANPLAGGKKGSHQEIVRRRLVRRAHVRTIVAAWVTTAPACAVLAALLFYLLNTGP
jgi:PiT family inorganic phosphate transporter